MNYPIHRPNFRERSFFFLSGIISSAPFPILVTSLISYFLFLDLPNFYANLISVALVAPVLEEFAKVYPLFYRHGETRKSIFTLGFLTGLGFGLTEFVIYVFLLHTPAFFRLPALLFHATNTSITAYGIGKKQTLPYYLLAVFFHFFYNFSVLSGGFWLIGGIAAALGSYLTSIYLSRKVTQQPISETLLIG